MLRQRNEVLKWVGIVSIVLLVGWYLWQQNQTGEEVTWLNQSGGAGQGRADNGQSVWGKAARDENSNGLKSGIGGGTGQGNAGGEGGDGGQTGGNNPETGGRVIVVHAAGAIKQPGVYYLPSEARVVDLVKAAGGIANSADLNEINLAEYLNDGEKVYIPYRGGGGAVATGSSGSASTAGTRSSFASNSGSTVGNGGSSSGALASSSRSATASSSSGGGSTATTTARYGSYGGGQNSYSQSGYSSAGGRRVNINTASSGELENLPGIGLSRAQAIIQYRNDHGRFQQIEDIKAVSGIGDKIFAKLETLITV